MTKTTRVRTNDPEKTVFNLVVKGKVEKVADILPSTVYLNGKSGDTLESVVTITPSEKYKFSILGLEQKINTKIKATLIEPINNMKSWQVKITGMSDKPKDLYDVLTLKTDSQYRPTITIRVYASFQENEKS